MATPVPAPALVPSHFVPTARDRATPVVAALALFALAMLPWGSSGSPSALSWAAAGSASVAPTFDGALAFWPVVAATLSRFLEFMIELGCTLLLIVLFWHGGVPASFVLLPWLILLLLLLALGLAMPIAALSVFYYDVRHLLAPFLAALFYISPVFYSVEMVPDVLRPVYYINPIAFLLNIFHTVLYDGEWPSLPVLATATAVMAGTFLIGYAIFNRYKHLFAEVV